MRKLMEMKWANARKTPRPKWTNGVKTRPPNLSNIRLDNYHLSNCVATICGNRNCSFDVGNSHGAKTNAAPKPIMLTIDRPTLVKHQRVANKSMEPFTNNAPHLCTNGCVFCLHKLALNCKRRWKTLKRIAVHTRSAPIRKPGRKIWRNDM